MKDHKNVNIGAEKNDIDLDAITCFMTCVKISVLVLGNTDIRYQGQI